MNHGDIRITSQALPMPRANPEQREAVVIALVVEGRKLLSAHDCAPQLTRHPWQLHAALHQQHQYLCRSCAPPPPPTGPTTTRLIKVVTKRTSHWSSFSQLDGQDNSVDDSESLLVTAV